MIVILIGQSHLVMARLLVNDNSIPSLYPISVATYRLFRSDQNKPNLFARESTSWNYLKKMKSLAGFLLLFGTNEIFIHCLFSPEFLPCPTIFRCHKKMSVNGNRSVISCSVAKLTGLCDLRLVSSVNNLNHLTLATKATWLGLTDKNFA